MGSGVYNLQISQYATYIMTFVWSAGTCGCSTVGATITPVDLVGYTATLQIRQFVSGPLVVDLSSYIVLGGTAGTITLTVPSSVTAGFTWWNGVYDLLLTSSSGIATRLLQGSVTVTPGVST